MRMKLWLSPKQLSAILKLRKFRHLPVLAITSIGLAGQISPAASDLPTDQQVIAFLTQSIDWYRHCAIEAQIATDPVDIVYLQDNRAGAAEIVKLSFDFGKADAQATATRTADNQKGATATGSPDLAQFVQLENSTELQSRQAREEIETINNSLETAHGAHRRELQAALDATQSRLDVLQAGLATLRQLVEFMQAFRNRETGDLASTIDDLARTVPDVISPITVAPQTQPPAPSVSAKSDDSGILALSSEVSALGRKLSVVDDEIRRTDALRRSSGELRSPLLVLINRRLPAVTEKSLQASDLAELQRKKSNLDELAALVKTLSPAIVALDKQKVLLAAYSSHLKSWRAAVFTQDKKTWQKLISRLLGAAAIIGALVLIGVVVRRVTRRHMADTEGRHIILVVQRVAIWITIVAVAALAFASDLTSLATFLGLVAAGLAVALQSVIVSAVGYFVLVGRRGIRIGDQVQISGLRGEVTDIGWLQFQLKEIDTRTQQPTGNVITFSNSIVLASPSTGVSKFNRKDLKSAQFEAAAKA